MSSRREERATESIRREIAVSAQVPIEVVGADDDLVDDLKLRPHHLESLGLILEERFSISIPERMWTSPLYRTPAALAEWCIRQSDLAAEEELRRQRRRRA